MVLIDDVAAAADRLRDYCALYIGGMGSREQNFYNLACRMASRRRLAGSRTSTWGGHHREAAEAVPIEFIDETALLGSPQRVAQRLRRYEDVGVTTLAVATGGRMTRGQAAATLAMLAELHPSPRSDARAMTRAGADRRRDRLLHCVSTQKVCEAWLT